MLNRSYIYVYSMTTDMYDLNASAAVGNVIWAVVAVFNIVWLDYQNTLYFSFSQHCSI